MAQDVKSCKLVAHLWKETTMRPPGGAQVRVEDCLFPELAQSFPAKTNAIWQQELDVGGKMRQQNTHMWGI